ncbi:mechanosensitive ion channel family protein [Hymenobacter yonginensis]|uniref:mechanosensitive ion channel family protein n=1 Tax=Hymenobacter yonginensis TaxID=748197 RepID=UPI0038CC0C46
MDFSLAWQKLNQIGRDLMLALPNIVFGLVTFGVFMLLARGVRALVQRVTSSRSSSQSLVRLLSRLSYVGMLILGVLVTVTIILPGFTPASLVSALGVGGIAIGFAFKDIFQNFLAGVLLLTEPFKIGDQIKYKEFEGTVEDIQTRATAIKTYDGRRVIIPNAELFTQRRDREHGLRQAPPAVRRGHRLRRRHCPGPDPDAGSHARGRRRHD